MTASGGGLSLRRVLDDAGSDEAVASLAERLVSRRLLGEHADRDRARAAARLVADHVLAHGERFEVDADGVVPHGHVVLVREGEDVVLLDLQLDDVALAPEVGDLVEDLARHAGARRLAVALPPGDVVRTALGVGGGFRAVTCCLRRDLDHRLPAPTATAATMEAVLRPVTREDSAQAAAWERAPDQHLLVGHEPGDPTAVLGTVWLSTARPMVLVQDLQVPPRRRGQGHGSALLAAVARWAQDRGSHAVGIDLAADDHVARGLADHLGFHLVEEYCVKDLVTPTPATPDL